MATFNEIISASTPTLVDVFATWCGPCKAIAPMIKELKNDYGETLRVLKVDIDKNQPFAEQHQIKGVPTLMLYKNGELKWRQSGVVPTHELKSQIDQLS